MEPQFLDVGSGAERRRIAYLRKPAAAVGRPRPGLVWLSGLKSEMTSTKASAIADWARAQGLACLRFDYSGHGQSDGRFEEGTVTRWLEEAETAFRSLTRGPQVLVGSSMGGYIALLLLRRLSGSAPSGEAARITGLVLIAPAWDMTELMWRNLPSAARSDIEEKGAFLRPSRYGDGPYPITRALIEDGRGHLIGKAPFDPGRPVHIVHGLQDPDVPWSTRWTSWPTFPATGPAFRRSPTASTACRGPRTSPSSSASSANWLIAGPISLLGEATSKVS